MLMVSNKLLRQGEYTPSVRELRTWLLGKGAMGIQLVTGISPPANRSAKGPFSQSTIFIVPLLRHGGPGERGVWTAVHGTGNVCFHRPGR